MVFEQTPELNVDVFHWDSWGTAKAVGLTPALAWHIQEAAQHSKADQSEESGGKSGPGPLSRTLKPIVKDKSFCSKYIGQWEDWEHEEQDLISITKGHSTNEE